MIEFGIGDRIICLVDSPSGNNSIHENDAGVICRLYEDKWVGVCWDNPVDNGHSCLGECEYGYGWAVPAAVLDFEPDDDKPPFQFDDEEFRNLFRDSGACQ